MKNSKKTFKKKWKKLKIVIKKWKRYKIRNSKSILKSSNKMTDWCVIFLNFVNMIIFFFCLIVYLIHSFIKVSIQISLSLNGFSSLPVKPPNKTALFCPIVYIEVHPLAWGLSSPIRILSFKSPELISIKTMSDSKSPAPSCPKSDVDTSPPNITKRSPRAQWAATLLGLNYLLEIISFHSFV